MHILKFGLSSSVRLATLFTALFCSLLTMTACSHKPVSAEGSSAAISEMLDQINEAILDSKKECGDAPEITSVQVDLQLGMNSSTQIGFPLNMVFPVGESNSNMLNKVSLRFTPKSNAAVSTGTHPKNRALTSAIEGIYRSVAQANPAYQFQDGSVQIQCTLENSLSVSVGNSGGGNGGSGGGSSRGPQAATSSSTSSSLVLVPVQFSDSASNQSVQTITLNFGPKSTKVSSAATAAQPTKLAAPLAAPVTVPTNKTPDASAEQNQETN